MSAAPQVPTRKHGALMSAFDVSQFMILFSHTFERVSSAPRRSAKLVTSVRRRWVVIEDWIFNEYGKDPYIKRGLIERDRHHQNRYRLTLKGHQKMCAAWRDVIDALERSLLS